MGYHSEKPDLDVGDNVVGIETVTSGASRRAEPECARSLHVTLTWYIIHIIYKWYTLSEALSLAVKNHSNARKRLCYYVQSSEWIRFRG